MKAAKSAYSAGDTASIEVFRNGETLTFSITFDEEPANNLTQQADDNQQNTQTPSIPGNGQNGQNTITG